MVILKFKRKLSMSGRCCLWLSGFSPTESESQKSIMQAKLSALEEEAYQLAGHPFSLSTPDDIAQVNFYSWI